MAVGRHDPHRGAGGRREDHRAGEACRVDQVEVEVPRADRVQEVQEALEGSKREEQAVGAQAVVEVAMVLEVDLLKSYRLCNEA